MSQDPATYRSPTAPVPQGKAPGMTSRLLSDHDGVKEYVVIFAKGDEVLSGVTDFATREHIVAARFTAIGALSRATVGWFDKGRKAYKLNRVDEQVELASLIGDVGLVQGKPAIHTHMTVGLSDGSVRGGHLVEAVTFPTVELFLTAFAAPLQKLPDPETGLSLFHPDMR